MQRSTLLLLVVLIQGACNPANSQKAEEVEHPPVSVQQPSDQEEIAASRQTAITRAVSAATPAVVSINVIAVEQVAVRDPFMNDPFFEQFFGRRRARMYQRQVKALGSGFVISPDGYIATNNHVVRNATAITVSLHTGETMQAELVGRDEATDIALLKVDAGHPLDYLRFASSQEPLVGEWAIALGNPFGLFEATEPTVTVGVVSAVGRDFEIQERAVYRDMIQTDAAINQGNSGGPLVNADAEVMGLNTFIFTQSGGSIGLGFAVPARKVERIIAELKENGFVDRSYYTGLTGYDINDGIAKALGLESTAGLIVQDVGDGSPAETAGFQPYDVITSLGGEDVENLSGFQARLYDFRPGDTVEFGVIRDGKPLTLTMVIGRTEG